MAVGVRLIKRSGKINIKNGEFGIHWSPKNDRKTTGKKGNL